jgi:hypothetical protein
MKPVKTVGYCPLCGPVYGKHVFQNKAGVDVTQFTCETHKTPLQPEKPATDPSRAKFLLPFLKAKKKVDETVINIRQASFEKHAGSYLKVLEGTNVREGMKEPYARVLALVQQHKCLTTKHLGALLGIPAAKAAGWLERLRVLNLVKREKQLGPIRMVWHYSLVIKGKPAVATALQEICERLKHVEALLAEGGSRSFPVVPPPAPHTQHLCPPPKTGEPDDAKKAVIRELDALFANGGMKWAKFTAAEVGQKNI